MDAVACTALNALQDPVLVLRVDGTIRLVNAAAAAFLGRTEASVPGRSIFDALSSNDADNLRWALKTIGAGGRSLHVERTVGERCFDISLEPVIAPSGKVAEVVVHARDITARRQAEARQRQSETMLRTVIDQLPHWILWKDCQSRYLGCNRAFALACGVRTPDIVVGRTDADFCTPDVAALLRREDEEVLRTGRTLVLTEPFVPIPSRTPMLMEKIKLPLRSEAGDILGIIVIAIDVAERKRAEDQLIAAKREAERANAARTRLIAAASHDLRQPLQATALFTGLLEHRVTEPALLSLVHKAQTALTSAIALLDDLLYLSKLEAGAVVPKVGPVPLGPMLGRLYDDFAPQAADRGLDLRLVSADRTVRSDPLLLERLVRNLIANAIRYTDHGGVLVGCRQRGAHVRVEIWDTGLGIPEEHLPRLFDDFHPVQGRAHGGRGGMGLGLITVKRIAAVLQHTVTVRSRVGRGSVFAVEAAAADRISAPRLDDNEP
ncbi:PAS domain S-box-containing protein [Azospirillum canadense]|nr:PAS domain S-box-containing protein [Azospirillum canadense]